MPLRPDFSTHEPDQRFDRYRDRVGRLFREAEEVGLVLVTTEPFAESTGGHLWWQRWTEPYDILWLWTIVDSKCSDHVVPSDAADDELEAYDAGRFEYYGEALRVEWLGAEESQHLRHVEWGM